MQDMLSKESATSEKNGVSITMNGNMEITALSLPSDLDKTKLEAATKDCLNDVIKKTQKMMAQKMQEMGGLGGLLGS
jgi:DNA-binding protein YbaB